ncbi:hypothetical protein [Microbispora sp. GKU 823]|uniref:hypothetical protein n=1 Tax=Microbispora sp. GKU 823 TaxID=1652100 RepID=UPI0009A3E3DE|nr:hypothetical protein [Microbispora sp. GKU 823]OPG12609.1 hypothetical protein B1L11_13690 [Microbispora sp. GKU 823]
MSAEIRFQIRRGVLRLRQPPDSGDLLFLCWPVLVYRVTAPVVRVRHLDIIEKVVLALCQAGIRQHDEIAAHIHQSPELCAHVLRQLRDSGQIDRYGVPTEAGTRTLATSRLGEEPELVVTHVFQDPWTERLWPRAAADLRFHRVHGVRDTTAELRLNTAGSPRPISAHVVTAEPRRARTPTAQEIIDAVAGQRKAELARRVDRLTDERGGRNPSAYLAEEDLGALAGEIRLPHEAVVQRVLRIGEPTPEYLLLWVTGNDEVGGGPRACDPFGLDPDPTAQALLTERVRADPALAAAVAGASDAAAARDAENYRAAEQAVRRNAEPRLVRRLGPELRRRPEALKLLLGMEEAAARGGESGVETVAREAYRLYEYLFRRLAAEFPPPDRPSWAVGERTVSTGVVRAALRAAARDVGLDGLPGVYLGRQVGDIAAHGSAGRLTPPERGYVNELTPFILIAAADSNSPHRSRHPLRDLARARPKVLTHLDELRLLRNRGTHATRDATVEDDIDWCRELAMDAARLVVSMPPPSPERN